jgi:hypothetical protein
MRTGSCFAAILIMALTFGSRPASALHDADVTDSEFQCQYKTEIIAWRNFTKRIACVVQCQRDARDGGNVADCSPPFAGATQGCVNGVNGKAQGGICKACNSDTPECYPTFQNCPDLADAELAPTQASADALLPTSTATIGKRRPPHGRRAEVPGRDSEDARQVRRQEGDLLRQVPPFEHRGSTPRGAARTTPSARPRRASPRRHAYG